MVSDRLARFAFCLTGRISLGLVFPSVFSLEFLLDWISTPVYWMTWNLPKAMRLNWTFGRPRLALALKFVQDIKLPEDCQLCLLNFEALSIIKNRTSYFHDLELRPNGETEQRLLQFSTLGWFPHEVAQIRVIDGHGEEVCSPVFHGRRSSLGRFEILSTQMKRAILQARRRGLIICEVEIAHTHPSIEVMIEHAGEQQFIFNGLSATDRKLGERLASFCDYPIRIKAITTAANYSKIF